jgi:hypothetical protein
MWEIFLKGYTCTKQWWGCSKGGVQGTAGY